ncbi:MAG: amidohydrolase family protein [Acidimicrobiia bacterium]
MSQSTVIVNASALVIRSLDPPVPDGWVLIEDGLVTAHGSGNGPQADLVVDASGCIVIPGLVCAHHHLYQGISRGVWTEPGLGEWLEVHYERWSAMSSADVAAAARLSIAQLLLSGCTTVTTLEYLHPEGDDFVSPVLDASSQLGIRLLYVRGTAPQLEFDVVERLSAKGIDTSRLVEPPEKGLARIVEFLRKPQTDRLRFGCGPTTPVLSDGGEFHHALNDIAENAGVPVHLHYHPIEVPEADSALDPARRLGLLRRGNWFAHGSRLTDEDVALLGREGVGVVHCPSTSLRLGYRVPRLQSWGQHNDRVAIAVDGAASNDRGSMLNEAQLAWYIQSQPHLASGGRLSPERVLHMATEGAALTIGWEGLGSLTVGSAGDCAIFDLTDLDSAGASSLDWPLFGLFATHQGANAKHVFVGGGAVVVDGNLRDHDHAEIARHGASARRDLDLRLKVSA